MIASCRIRSEILLTLGWLLLAGAGHALAEPPMADTWDKASLEPLDREPLLTKAPTYPAQAFRERREGSVIVCFRVLRDGRVQRPYVLASSAKIFEKSALKAMRASSFRADDDPSAPDSVEACRTFRFLLTPGEPD